MATSEHVVWARLLARLVDAGHLLVADQLAATLDAEIAELGLTADLLVVDASQLVLTSLRTVGNEQIDLVNSLGGRAYQLGEILAGTADDGTPVLWVPVLDGTDRIGVMRVGLGDPAGCGHVDDAELRGRLWIVASLMGHIVATKTVYSDRLRRWRSNGPISAPSELLWQLLPPRTFATDRLVVSAVLEPHDRVAGDAFDYNVDGELVDLAVFDAVGHDLQASITTALAITAVRNARRAGVEDLVAIAAHADGLIGGRPGPPQFATAILARLDVGTGQLTILNAGHPPPLLVRGGRVVKELGPPPRTPLGVRTPAGTDQPVTTEQLEPGDRLLFYSDGVVEARDRHGAFFGEERLVEMTEHAAASGLSAPETLRRLAAAVLEHQGGLLQDDATLLLAEWSADAYRRMYPGDVLR
ncbi:PP2C family protein-serine/threonine phosphatase [Pseudonocardia petroleophila]|uniref:Serine/threonine-protein phosphatase n=1 Tax=Pseudonocardia petroleophila TaxID=37331 RepID=A0A7G7MCV0_9PSEU|nr:PP2C family protein-serine/threonine phosphatase [Pseudonocardia petroleophila]QNG50611.1 serine/threonine-protein phosphatase [Pseudonocardia petroleophila]